MDQRDRTKNVESKPWGLWEFGVIQKWHSDWRGKDGLAKVFFKVVWDDCLSTWKIKYQLLLFYRI